MKKNEWNLNISIFQIVLGPEKRNKRIRWKTIRLLLGSLFGPWGNWGDSDGEIDDE